MSGGFSSLHPAVCFAYYVGVLLLGMLLLHPLFLLTAITILIVLQFYHDGGERLRKQLPLYMLMGGSIALLNPLFSHRGRVILFYFLDQPITLESVLYGVTMMLSLLLILLAFLSFYQVITTDKFMYLFSSVAPKTALLTSVAIRFVPLLKRRLKQISLVQRTNGIDVKVGSLRKRMRDGMTLLRVLITWSLEEALQTADSMKARGYNTGRRSHYVVYRMERRDWTVLLFLAGASAVSIAGWMRGYGTLQIYPTLAAIHFAWGDGIVFTSFCAFLLLPIYFEREERLRWKSSV